ncbi:uncharacterized protein BKA78DRAFT_16518 [Phyllosticta capitalensis]|uniref:uncharacterized protein n=1 Tax=Phyllosticta capitalensis TaxID=121624 RepID=UPI0031317AF7
MLDDLDRQSFRDAVICRRLHLCGLVRHYRSGPAMSKPPNRGQREDRRCRGAADEALRLGGCTSCPGPWRRGQGGRRVGWHRSKVDGRPTTSSIHSTAAGAGHLDSRPLDLTKLSSPSSSPPPPPPLNVAGAGAAIGVGAGLVEIHIVLLLSPGADQPRHGGANDVRTQSVCCAWGRVGKAKVEWLDGWRGQSGNRLSVQSSPQSRSTRVGG